ncbi:MAG: ComF family protein [Hyphomicrobiaceae bacterium]
MDRIEGPAGQQLRIGVSLLAGVRMLAAAVADFIVPPSCLACRAPLAMHHSLCGPCWREVMFIRPPVCDRLGIPLPFDTGEPALSAAAIADPPVVDRLRAVAGYSGTMRLLVHRYKYSDRQDVRRLLARWLTEAAQPLLDGADLVVPVPLHRWRLLRRTFNQSAILARDLGRATGVPVDPFVLSRVRSTRSQVGLARAQRRRNVAGAFAIGRGRRDKVRGRSILLVDDVATTGATLDACARVLRAAGAVRVDAVVLARVTPVDPA